MATNTPQKRKRHIPWSTLWAVETWDGFACNWRVEKLSHIAFTRSEAMGIQKKQNGFPATRIVRYARDDWHVSFYAKDKTGKK